MSPQNSLLSDSSLEDRKTVFGKYKNTTGQYKTDK